MSRIPKSTYGWCSDANHRPKNGRGGYFFPFAQKQICKKCAIDRINARAADNALSNFLDDVAIDEKAKSDLKAKIVLEDTYAFCKLCLRDSLTTKGRVESSDCIERKKCTKHCDFNEQHQMCICCRTSRVRCKNKCNTDIYAGSFYCFFSGKSRASCLCQTCTNRKNERKQEQARFDHFFSVRLAKSSCFNRRDKGSGSTTPGESCREQPTPPTPASGPDATSNGIARIRSIDADAVSARPPVKRQRRATAGQAPPNQHDSDAPSPSPASEPSPVPAAMRIAAGRAAPRWAWAALGTDREGPGPGLVPLDAEDGLLGDAFEPCADSDVAPPPSSPWREEFGADGSVEDEEEVAARPAPDELGIGEGAAVRFPPAPHASHSQAVARPLRLCGVHRRGPALHSRGPAALTRLPPPPPPPAGRRVRWPARVRGVGTAARAGRLRRLTSSRGGGRPSRLARALKAQQDSSGAAAGGRAGGLGGRRRVGQSSRLRHEAGVARRPSKERPPAARPAERAPWGRARAGVGEFAREGDAPPVWARKRRMERKRASKKGRKRSWARVGIAPGQHRLLKHLRAVS